MATQTKESQIKDEDGALLSIEYYTDRNNEQRVQITTAYNGNEDEVVNLKETDWMEFLKEQLGGTDHV